MWQHFHSGIAVKAQETKSFFVRTLQTTGTVLSGFRLIAFYVHPIAFLLIAMLWYLWRTLRGNKNEYLEIVENGGSYRYDVWVCNDNLDAPICFVLYIYSGGRWSRQTNMRSVPTPAQYFLNYFRVFTNCIFLWYLISIWLITYYQRVLSLKCCGSICWALCSFGVLRTRGEVSNRNDRFDVNLCTVLDIR